jgi:hypothetical protein
LLPQHTADKRSIIDKLSKLLNLLNFGTENLSFANKNKIYSSFRDQQHLEHAYICDFFITNDKNLKKRGELIYSITDIQTKFISVESFHENYIKPFIERSKAL